MNISIGCDIEQVSRFVNKINNQTFLQKLFTENEINYCKSKAKPEQHFAARFCAKEAVIKSLSDFEITDVFYKDIEIINKENGVPVILILKESCKNITIKISLSHSKDSAIATVISYKNI